MQLSDRLAVATNENVALVDLGRRTWTVGIDAHYHDAGSTAFDRHGLQAQTEISACNAAAALELGRDPVDGRGGNDEHAPARPKHRHSERFSRGVYDHATFRRSPRARVELDPGADFATSQRSPGSPAERDNAEAGNRRAFLRPDRERERPGARHRGGR